VSGAEAPFRTERVIGHESVLLGLKRASREGRLPHALLLRGPRGIGKFLLALHFARWLLCAADEQDPCNRCGPCKRTASLSHPDLFVIDPVSEELETIPIARVAAREAEVESAEAFFSHRPGEGGWRIAIVREMERAQEAVQNALLKMLEEPSPGCLWMLECSQPELLLPTIHSRCVAIHLSALDAPDARKVLEAAGIPSQRASELLRWTPSPGQALLLDAQNGPGMRALIDAVARGAMAPLEAAAAVFELEGQFEGSTPSARSRERARTAVSLVLALLADGLRLAAGVSREDLAHGDLLGWGAPLSEAPWRRALRTCMRAREDIERNLSPEACTERALLAVASLAGRGAALAR
jgi:DNA polymerase-3 subunit delta'